jgi:hypothetical protein
LPAESFAACGRSMAVSQPFSALPCIGLGSTVSGMLPNAWVRRSSGRYYPYRCVLNPVHPYSGVNVGLDLFLASVASLFWLYGGCFASS